MSEIHLCGAIESENFVFKLVLKISNLKNSATSVVINMRKNRLGDYVNCSPNHFGFSGVQGNSFLQGKFISDPSQIIYCEDIVGSGLIKEKEPFTLLIKKIGDHLLFIVNDKLIYTLDDVYYAKFDGFLIREMRGKVGLLGKEFVNITSNDSNIVSNLEKEVNVQKNTMNPLFIEEFKFQSKQISLLTTEIEEFKSQNKKISSLTEKIEQQKDIINTLIDRLDLLETKKIHDSYQVNSLYPTNPYSEIISTEDATATKPNNIKQHVPVINSIKEKGFFRLLFKK